MKKIGFIDFFLDNFHSKNYPEWISKYSNGEFEVTCAYALSESLNGGITNAEWSKKYNIPLLPTVDDVIEKSDYIMVLSPSHPEMHEMLCEKALKCGKRVYVDKAFAPDLPTAKRLFDMADKYCTPCCSASALACVSSYQEIDRKRLITISSKSPGSFEVYAIHQFEPIIAMMGKEPKRIMATGSFTFPSFVIEFEDGRIAKIEQFSSAAYELYAGYDDGTSVHAVADEEIFKQFILSVIDFFKTGKLIAEHRQTLMVMALIDAAKIAINKPFEWVSIPKI